MLANYQHILRTDLTSVTEAFRRAGYDEAARAKLEKVLEPGGTGSAANISAALDSTSGDVPVHVLLRTFAMAMAVPPEQIEAAIGKESVRALRELGVLTDRDGGVGSQVSILPVSEFFTTRDFAASFTNQALTGDHVLGISPTTMALARLTVRREVGLAVDIGVGQGYQSLLAAGHAKRVVGTDINARALAMAALSAQLSGREIELRQGTFFEPLEDLKGKIDLLVSNPPFMIAPPMGVVGVAGSADGDSCVQLIAEQGPAYLAPGGFLCMFCNWHHPDAENWASRPAGWIRDRGVDAWIMRFETSTPRVYAMRWTRELKSAGYAGHLTSSSPALETWVEYLQERNIGGVTLGAIVLRRREGANWARGDALEFAALAGEAGVQIERVFANETAMRNVSDEDLSQMRVRIAPTSVVEQRLRPLPGRGFVPERATLKQSVGFPMPLGVDVGVIDMLGVFDGTRTVRQAAVEAAQAKGGNADAALAHLAPMVRRLLETTHLEVVSAGAA